MTIANPFTLFTQWYNEALTLNVNEPTAMILATSNKQGAPSSRVILLKKYDERGFCFFTNFQSRKGSELLENPQAALCFYWDSLGKQIRIEGNVEQVSDQEADDYFATRRRESQIGAWASKQSQPMASRNEFEARIDHVTTQYQNNTSIPRPPHWSGFRLVPKRIEFWENREFRLHVRTVYERQNNDWIITTLYP